LSLLQFWLRNFSKTAFVNNFYVLWEISLKNRKRGYQAASVYETLKKMIITLELRPGEVLKEQVLADRLEVGRTPIREAILMLKAEGLAESHPNESPTVKDITLKGVHDFFEPFLAIEKLAVRLAMQNVTSEQLDKIKKTHLAVNAFCDSKDYWRILEANRKLHTLIALATDNEYVIFFHENLRDKAERLAYLAISAKVKSSTPLEQHYEKMCAEHEAIVKKLEERDPQIEKLIEQHVKLFRDRIMIYLQSSL
jgi:DNA-binding GntR family transcriptional regulator